jgi:hypothetical protein
MDSSLVDYVLLVDSRDRDYAVYPSPSEYRVTLPREYRNVVSAKLVNIDVPNSFFVFSRAAGNVSMDVSVYSSADGPALATREVTLPDGNYDTATMAAALVAALDAAFASVPAEFAVTFDASTLRMSLTCTQGLLVELDSTRSQKPIDTEWGLGYFLGFRKGASGRSARLTSPGVVTLNPWTYIVMEIDDLNAVEIGSRGGRESRSVFAKLTLSGNSWEVITLHRSCIVTGERALAAPVPRLTQMSVRFRFHDGRLVDFNDVEHSFSVHLRCREK